MRSNHYHIKQDDVLLERFIPISKHDIIQDLLVQSNWHDRDKEKFIEFCTILSALYHYKFHIDLEAFKQNYLPFCPDSDLMRKNYTEAEKKQAYDVLLERIENLLNQANYEKLSHHELERAVDEKSPYHIKVSIDFDDFEEVALYFRGSAISEDKVRDWRYLFLRYKTREIRIYQRLFLLIKFKTDAQRAQELRAAQPDLSEKAAQRRIRWLRRDLPTQAIASERIFLKLFKDIPRCDVEMLFPNQKVRLKLFDKIKLGITGGGGTIGAAISTIGKVSLALTNPIAFLLALGGLVGVLIRQVMNVFHQRTKYMMALSQSLYFQNLDNNMGVIKYLIDSAEEEECKEAILAYYFLLTEADKRHTIESLDHAVEHYIQQCYDIHIDFEVDDALIKLRREGILTESDKPLQVVDLQSACEILDKQWDDFFQPAQERDTLH